MNKECLKWEWDTFRNEVAVVEKEFVKANKNKYPDYFLLEKALNRKLNKLLGPKGDMLLRIHLALKLRKRPASRYPEGV